MDGKTIRQVDWLLHNLPALKLALASMEPPISRSIVPLSPTGPRGGESDPVQDLAVRRATISIVVDAVERAIASLRPEERRIYRLKYRNLATRRHMARMVFVSESTLDRRIERIRRAVALYVRMLPEDVMKAFWGEIDRVLSS